MAYQIAGVDVHKRMLAGAVADVEGDGDFRFERQQFGHKRGGCEEALSVGGDFLFEKSLSKAHRSSNGVTAVRVGTNGYP